jgi:hypothetical protein
MADNQGLTNCVRDERDFKTRAMLMMGTACDTKLSPLASFTKPPSISPAATDIIKQEQQQAPPPKKKKEQQQARPPSKQPQPQQPALPPSIPSAAAIMSGDKSGNEGASGQVARPAISIIPPPGLHAPFPGTSAAQSGPCNEVYPRQALENAIYEFLVSRSKQASRDGHSEERDDSKAPHGMEGELPLQQPRPQQLRSRPNVATNLERQGPVGDGSGSGSASEESDLIEELLSLKCRLANALQKR